jgi:hypothetical protein
MAEILPFSSSNPINKFSTVIDGQLYGFRARWNSRDTFDPTTNTETGAWYVDVADAAGDPIATGIKVTLGTVLGRQFNLPLFRTGALVAADLSGEGRNPTLDDLGTRVVVMWLSVAEILSLRVVQRFPDPSVDVV